MIREDKFLVSRRPYAVGLDGMTVEAVRSSASGLHSVRVPAVWYRRRRGQTVACIGYLWDSMHNPPQDTQTVLQRMDDGRYGGSCLGRWDGTGYWGAESPTVAEQHLAVLRPMLDHYPDTPPGYQGWWRYETSAELSAARKAEVGVL